MKQITALLACYFLSFTFQAAAEPMRDTSLPESHQLLAFDLNEELNNDAWEILRFLNKKSVCLSNVPAPWSAIQCYHANLEQQPTSRTQT